MRDEWFIRGQVPMTKAEVRAVSLSKLELDGRSVLLDVGAGTGSVSIEAVLLSPVKKVYAFEKNEDAIELFHQNRKKGGIGEEKLSLIRGTAPDSFPAFFKEMPTHAFIGGSSGRMEPLLDTLLQLNKNIRIVINVIALETLFTVTSFLKERKIEAETVSLQVSRAKKAGPYHLMQGQNPVYIISFGGKKFNE